MATAKVDTRDLAEGTCPPVCVRCGAEAVYSRTITVSHTGEGNPGVGCLVGSLLGGFIGALIARAASTETTKVTLPVCPTHARPRGLPNEAGELLIVLVMFTTLVVLGFGFLISQKVIPQGLPLGPCLLVGAIIFLGGLVALGVYTRHVIRSDEITDRWVVLTNVSREFARAVAAKQEADRQARLARWAQPAREPPAGGS
jgi:hypothetical protein